ncbi:hypothetical protein LLB_2503 [Legionella longbeachae D-4968]|nr:hypothetical protein LLB_2503 [Legionella longbeachae D-4968]
MNTLNLNPKKAVVFYHYDRLSALNLKSLFDCLKTKTSAL